MRIHQFTTISNQGGAKAAGGTSNGGPEPEAGELQVYRYGIGMLGGGFKHFFFSTLPGESSNLTNIFQRG